LFTRILTNLSVLFALLFFEYQMSVSVQMAVFCMLFAACTAVSYVATANDQITHVKQANPDLVVLLTRECEKEKDEQRKFIASIRCEEEAASSDDPKQPTGTGVGYMSEFIEFKSKKINERKEAFRKKMQLAETLVKPSCEEREARFNPPGSLPRYHIVSNINITALADEVNLFIRAGWTPLGGVTHTTSQYGGPATQALWREAE
jgi:hypothetical protein